MKLINESEKVIRHRKYSELCTKIDKVRLHDADPLGLPLFLYGIGDDHQIRIARKFLSNLDFSDFQASASFLKELCRVNAIERTRGHRAEAKAAQARSGRSSHKVTKKEGHSRREIKRIVLETVKEHDGTLKKKPFVAYLRQNHTNINPRSLLTQLNNLIKLQAVDIDDRFKSKRFIKKGRNFQGILINL